MCYWFDFQTFYYLWRQYRCAIVFRFHRSFFEQKLLRTFHFALTTLGIRAQDNPFWDLITSSKDKLPLEKTVHNQIKKAKKQKSLHAYWRTRQRPHSLLTCQMYVFPSWSLKVFVVRGTCRETWCYIFAIQLALFVCALLRRRFKTQRAYRNGQNSLQISSGCPASSTAAAGADFVWNRMS